MERIAEVTLSGVRLDARMGVFDAGTVVTIADRLMILQNLYAEAQAENAALRAKWDAVPVQAMGELMDAFAEEGFPFGYKRQRNAITSWLDAQAVQP